MTWGYPPWKQCPEPGLPALADFVFVAEALSQVKRGFHPTQRTQRNERNSRKKRKLQPIGTELSSIQLNSNF